ncbi:hypothetical protein F8388_002081 [Cannabis sativa]|uniref:Uncharacterized protein n=1 Tax=Cannabis sativa TaxID=3483 RepID=A0A7J6DX16_CANSA|nr:hypothetical protein F8388_002081 [Cannabis sativa]
MDSDFWTSRLAAAKRQYTLHHHNQTSHLDRLGMDDLEVEDDIRPEFPCPYCYEDFDIASLCSHLEDDHSCESKVTVCPVCSVRVSRDMLSHITLQHAHFQALSLLGRDLREAHLQVLLGGGGGYRSNNSSVSNAATDPLLSSLILNYPTSEAEEISKSVVANADDTSMKKVCPPETPKAGSANGCLPELLLKLLNEINKLDYECLFSEWVGVAVCLLGLLDHLGHGLFKYFDPSLSYEEREKRMKQATGRAGFVQDLFLTTLLGD